MCKNLEDEVGGVHLVNGSISSVAYSKVCILTIVEVHYMWGCYTIFTSAMVVGSCMKVSHCIDFSIYSNYDVCICVYSSTCIDDVYIAVENQCKECIWASSH